MSASKFRQRNLVYFLKNAHRTICSTYSANGSYSYLHSNSFNFVKCFRISHYQSSTNNTQNNRKGNRNKNRGIRNENNQNSQSLIPKYELSDEEWKKKLQPQEYEILRKKGTEFPWTGEYTSMKVNSGYFVCRGCFNPLYSWKSKFESNCGWPAFDMCFMNSVKHKSETDGTDRIEIMCNKCDSHLGHVFLNEGYDNLDAQARSKQRHCVNSLSIRYISDADSDNNSERDSDSTNTISFGCTELPSEAPLDILEV